MGQAIYTAAELARRSDVVSIASGELVRQESIISDGLRTFVEVGRALMEIRDGQLYKERGSKTFETYCRERWEMSARRSYQLIDASLFADANNCSHPPANEAQVRPLLALPEGDRLKAWEMSVETAPDGRVTAKHVTQVVRGILPTKSPPPFNPIVAFADLKNAVASLVSKLPDEHQDSAWSAIADLLKERRPKHNKRSLLRYPGSKEKVAAHILAHHFPVALSSPVFRGERPIEYREPFFGSGSFGFQALAGLPSASSVWINDKDHWLACLWQSVHTNPDALNELVGKFEPTTDAFFRFKEEDGSDIDPVVAGFRKLALHQISFSGIGAVAGGPIGGKNQTGEFDVGCRWNASTTIGKINQWHKALSAFGNRVRVTCVDFAELLTDAPSNAFIYLDPPYYEKGGELYKHSFDDDTHRRLAGSLQHCDAQWVLSYDEHTFIRELYESWADISSIDLKYTVAASSSNREVKQELIIKPRREA